MCVTHIQKKTRGFFLTEFSVHFLGKSLLGKDFPSSVGNVLIKKVFSF